MSARFRSYWQVSAPAPLYPPLEADRDCEVAVLGAGIVGVSTGKVSSLNGLVYQELTKLFGAGRASDYAAASQAGLGWIAANAESFGIECDLRRKPNLTWAESEGGRAKIVAEAEAARAAPALRGARGVDPRAFRGRGDRAPLGYPGPPAARRAPLRRSALAAQRPHPRRHRDAQVGPGDGHGGGGDPRNPPRLHRQVERRRTHLGLPLPRLALRPARRRADRGPAVRPLLAGD